MIINSFIQLLWSSHIELMTKNDQPRMLLYHADDSAQIFISSHTLHVLNDKGEREWTFNYIGNSSSMKIGRMSTGSSIIILGTGRILDEIISGANAIGYLRCEGYIYFLTMQGTISNVLKLDEMVTALEYIESPTNDNELLVVGTVGIGYRPPGKITLYRSNGIIEWRHFSRGRITALYCCKLSGGDYILAGTEEGELLAITNSGQVLWSQHIGSGKVENIRILTSSGSEETAHTIIAGTRDGILAALSLGGVMKWKDVFDQSITSLICKDINSDGEDELIVGYLNLVQCFDGYGKVLWKANIEGRIFCIEHLEIGYKEIRLLVCTDANGLILNAINGSFLNKYQLGGRGIASCAISNKNQSGWVICVSQQPKNIMRRLLGLKNVELMVVKYTET